MNIKVVDCHGILVLTYVADGLIIGSSSELISRTKNKLKPSLEMTYSGKCKFFTTTSATEASVVI